MRTKIPTTSTLCHRDVASTLCQYLRRRNILSTVTKPQMVEKHRQLTVLIPNTMTVDQVEQLLLEFTRARNYTLTAFQRGEA